MSNLLDSILNNMQAPPVASQEQRKRNREEMERRRRVRQQQRSQIVSFRKRVEEDLVKFQTSPDRFLEFEALDKIFRGVIYEVAELCGLTCASFGVDQVDRYTVVYHKNGGPGEDERYVRNNGGKWNDEIAARIAEERLEEQRMYEMEGMKRKITYTCTAGRGGRARLFVPNGPSYVQKYMHLSTLPDKKTNENYGEVPSELKRDHRSIEETLKDIQQKKKKKTAAAAVPSTSANEETE